MWVLRNRDQAWFWPSSALQELDSEDGVVWGTPGILEGGGGGGGGRGRGISAVVLLEIPDQAGSLPSDLGPVGALHFEELDDKDGVLRVLSSPKGSVGLQVFWGRF